LIAVGLDHHHPAAGGGVHLTLADLLLQRFQLSLELLCLLDEVAESFHELSPRSGAGFPDSTAPGRASRPSGRTVVTSPSKRSTAACTAGCSAAAPGGAAALGPVNTTSRTSGRTRRAASRICCRYCRSISWVNGSPFATDTTSRRPSSATSVPSASLCPSIG